MGEVLVDVIWCFVATSIAAEAKLLQQYYTILTSIRAELLITDV
jgi:hypothetical protein